MKQCHTAIPRQFFIFYFLFFFSRLVSHFNSHATSFFFFPFIFFFFSFSLLLFFFFFYSPSPRSCMGFFPIFFSFFSVLTFSPSWKSEADNFFFFFCSFLFLPSLLRGRARQTEGSKFFSFFLFDVEDNLGVGGEDKGSTSWEWAGSPDWQTWASGGSGSGRSGRYHMEVY